MCLCVFARSKTLLTLSALFSSWGWPPVRHWGSRLASEWHFHCPTIQFLHWSYHPNSGSSYEETKEGLASTELQDERKCQGAGTTAGWPGPRHRAQGSLVLDDQAALLSGCWMYFSQTISLQQPTSLMGNGTSNISPFLEQKVAANTVFRLMPLASSKAHMVLLLLLVHRLPDRSPPGSSNAIESTWHLCCVAPRSSIKISICMIVR